MFIYHRRVQFIIAILLLSLCLGGFYLWQSFPMLWLQSQRWQMELSRYISQLLSLAQEHPIKALLSVSFTSLSYGLLHAIGPGHGKVIMASYLSTHPTKLKTSLLLSLFAALLQAVVAIALVSFLLLLMDSNIRQMSIQANQLLQLSFIAMILLGLRIAWSGINQYRQQQQKITIIKIGVRLSRFEFKARYLLPTRSVDGSCNCGHQHIATAQQLATASSIKDYVAIVLSIGIRPCSGALMTLIFAKSLNVYWLGIVSALTMGLGTAIAIALLAWMSHSGGALIRRYLVSSTGKQAKLGLTVKLATASLICIIGIIMFNQSSLLFSPLL